MFGKDFSAAGRVGVKICGITTLADALVAIHCGADALGFVLFPGSKRFVDPRTASDWMINLPPEVAKIAVMVNPALEDLLRIAGLPFIDAVQLHGHESPEFCRQVAEKGIRFVKAIPVGGSAPLGEIPNFFTDTVLLDSSSRRGFGGTGETFHWATGRRFVEEHPNLKVMVAGGLTPDNVAEAVRTMRPFAVDVTTGVELTPGRKEASRIRDFIGAVREA